MRRHALRTRTKHRHPEPSAAKDLRRRGAHPVPEILRGLPLRMTISLDLVVFAAVVHADAGRLRAVVRAGRRAVAPAVAHDALIGGDGAPTTGTGAFDGLLHGPSIFPRSPIVVKPPSVARAGAGAGDAIARRSSRARDVRNHLGHGAPRAHAGPRACVNCQLRHLLAANSRARCYNLQPKTMCVRPLAPQRNGVSCDDEPHATRRVFTEREHT